MREPWRQVALLPPRPLLRDWPVAGACAGLLLGLAELAWAWALGLALPPPRLAIPLLAASAGLCGGFAGGLGACFRTLGIRPMRSTVVGLMFAPLGWTVACRPALEAWNRGATPGEGELVALGSALLFAAAAGVLMAELGHRCERSGLPLSPLLTWATGGALVAALEWLGSGPPPVATPPLALGSGTVALATALALLGFELARRRSSRPRRSFTRLALGIGSCAAAGLLAPLAWPWLLYDHALPSLGEGPPNVLAVALEVPSGARRSTPESVELLRWQGISYGGLEAGASLADALTLPAGGGPLAAHLHRAGFATAAIQARQGSPPGFPEVDARGGPLHELAARAPWLHALPLLRGPGQPLVAGLGLDAPLRTPGELTRAATRWLLHWRTRRAPNPFFLLVDLRRAGVPRAGDSADRALGRLLADLDRLEVGPRTLVLVTLEMPARERARLVLRPPEAWPLRGGGRRLRDVEAGQVARALLALSRGEPVALPGLS